MKKLIAILLALVMLTGCSLATDRTFEDDSGMEDKLVGVFVTFDGLELDFDIEGYLNDHPGVLKGGEVTLEQGAGNAYLERLWAEPAEQGFRFPGVTGIYLCQMWEEDHWVGFSTEGFSNVETYVNRTETVDGIEETGTVCVPADTEDFIFYCNPVYMTPEGNYYALQGDSFHTSAGVGSMSTSLDQTLTWTEGEKETTYSAGYTVKIEGVAVADRVVLIHMSDDHRELSREEYTPDTLPESVEPAAGAAYLLVEQWNVEQVQRTLNQPGDDPIRVYYQSENNWCLPRFAHVNWTESE